MPGVGGYCSGVQNVSAAAEYRNIVRRLMNYIPYQQCQDSCSSFTYEAVEVQDQAANNIIIELIMAEALHITSSKYEFTFLPILTTLGGHIGVCRTVVWLGLSLIGLNNLYSFWKGINIKLS